MADLADIIKSKMGKRDKGKPKEGLLIIAEPKRNAKRDEALKDAIKDLAEAIRNEDDELAYRAFVAAHNICCEDCCGSEEHEDDGDNEDSGY